MNTPRWIILTLLKSTALLLMHGANAGAQVKENPLFTPDAARAATAAAGAIGVRHPLGTGALLSAGQHLQLWDVLPLPSAERVEAWDSEALKERVRAEQLGFDSQSLRPYFELGRVMDGMHRTAKAAMQNLNSLPAKQFAQDPEPDFVGVDPDDLPY